MTQVVADTTEEGGDLSLASLLGVLDAAREAFIALGPGGVIAGWTAATETLLGWSAGEAIGRPFADAMLPASARDAFGRAVGRLDAIGAEPFVGPVELPVRHRDGLEVWVEARLGRLRRAGEWYCHVFLRDITEKRAAEQELAKAEALQKLWTRNSSDVISRLAADGRIIYISPSCEELLGASALELIGTNGWELVHPQDVEALGGRDGHGEDCSAGDLSVRLRHRDGHWVWADVLSSVVPAGNGADEEIQVWARDITARRVRDEEFHQESKLEALGRLAAGLAHEINSPIQFVGDNSRFLAEAYQDLIRIVLFYRGLLDSTDPIGWEERRARMRAAEEGIEFDYLQSEIPSAVEQTLQGIERVSTIVRAMKMFSHPGHQEQVPADLNEALEATVTVARHQIKSVADLDFELGELPPVRCNIADLNQVFLNLLVNAADAIEETGRHGRIGVTTQLDGAHAVITINDTGGGIPDEVRSKIFDPFFTTKEVGRGSGQGLPLVRAVVQEGHGGTLSIATQAGEGTAFTVRLPVDGKPAE